MVDEEQMQQGAALSEYVTVDIYDQLYHLRGSEGGYVEHLAQVVDAKMRMVAAAGTVDSLRVAVLASLNLADELESLRERYAELAGSVSSMTQATSAVRSRSASLADLLDEVFHEVDAAPLRRAG